MPRLPVFPSPPQVAAAALIGLTAAAPAGADDGWRFGAALYGWFPSVDGSLTFPNGAAGPGGSGSADLSVDADQILDALDFVAMGIFEVRKGPWGAFTDIIYLDLGGSSDERLDALVPGGPGISVDAELDFKSTVWTLAAQHSLYESPQLSANGFAGFRMLAVDVDLALSVDGPLPPELPTARLSRDLQNWDGILGLRGEVRPGGNWFMPWYVDVGAGDSELTWMATAGVGYRFGWGDVVLAYRHLAYEIENDADAELDMSFGGAGLGVVLRF
jgi:hypothetical protein